MAEAGGVDECASQMVVCADDGAPEWSKNPKLQGFFEGVLLMAWDATGNEKLIHRRRGRRDVQDAI